MGERQVFIRFAGCNLSCQYCDTPETTGLRFNGGGQHLSDQEIVSTIRQFNEGNVLAVCITGGEPLLQADFLKVLLPKIRETAGLKIHLETNGTLPDALKNVLSWCDIIAMDIKLPSATGREFWTEHEEFLSAGAGKTFVKIVLDGSSEMDEFVRAIELVKKVSPGMAAILQPAAPGVNAKCVEPQRFQDFLREAKERLNDVRFLPQMHKLWGLA